MVHAGRPTELVTTSAAALRDLVEDVLEVARLDTPGVEQAHLQNVSISALACRAIACGGRDAELRVCRDATVRADPRRAERVLVNLITNAYRHAAPPVTVEVDGPRMRVREHGPGFPATLLNHGPQRFHTTASTRGLGLGLTIAVGQVRVLGADLRLENPADGGAQATLALTPAAHGPDTSGEHPSHPGDEAMRCRVK
ncbi:sensor histidine kinase [Streptomyces flavofungini]|nr:HAMP domain-containing sensor histidine kinase [Streptomyces flavofungini]